jgi:hypothetical protein
METSSGFPQTSAPSLLARCRRRQRSRSLARAASGYPQYVFRRRLLLGVTCVLLLAAVSAASATATVYFGGALAGRHIRPKSLSLSADGTLEVSKIHWTSWGGRAAVGRGEAEYHGCTPYCGTAPVHHAPVMIRLSNVRVCSGRAFYTHVRLTLASGQLLDPVFLRISWTPC